MDRVVILGAPGDGSVVAEAIIQAKSAGESIELIGFLNDSLGIGREICGFPVLGKLDDWQSLDENYRFVWALQRVGAMPSRVNRLKGLEIPERRWRSVRHPQSAIASTATIGVGSFVASFATVQPMASIGRFASLRAGACVGHHAHVADYAYVGPNATLSGYSELQEGASLGPNAVILERMTVGAYALVGIGAAVTKNVPSGAIVMGNPARPVRVARLPGTDSGELQHAKLPKQSP